METVGFIGLGNMGMGMGGNIQKADYPMVVFDIRDSAMQPFVQNGARSADSPAEVARCPFRKSCTSRFERHKRVEFQACSRHVETSLLHDKDIPYAHSSCVPSVPEP